MKMLFRFVTVLAALVTVACAPRERVVVILSTNDMHAKIERFARLAAAVERCRDTVSDVVLADAGDRWTGNALSTRPHARHADALADEPSGVRRGDARQP